METLAAWDEGLGDMIGLLSERELRWRAPSMS